MSGLSRSDRALAIIRVLREATKGMTPPMSVLIKERYGTDPFLILISCLLSLRARDAQTYEVVQRLFERAKTPHELVAVPTTELEEIIRPIGFFKKKAALIKDVASELINQFGGQVPASREVLLSIHGVGPKTAGLVLGEGFGIPALCVDVHVHRISNRLGIVRTKTPEQTEQALADLLPQEYWIEVNKLLVMWGQNICTPVSPRCSRCVLFPLCERRGVTTSR